MDAVRGILSSISGFFAMISGFFATVSAILAPVLSVISSIFSVIGNILSKCCVLVFLLGFYGLLLTFLWFLFRYMDKKRLTLPAVVFTLFFFIFLGGNILMISNDGKTESTQKAETVSTQAVSEPDAADAGSGDVSV